MSSLPLRYDFEMDTETRRREADRAERKRQKRAAKYSWCLQSR